MSKKSKVPKLVYVSPHGVSVRQDQEACDAGAVTGVYLADSLAILLDTASAESIRRESLWHEIGHACWKTAGLDKWYDDSDGQSDGEKIINALFPRLLAVLRDNPGLLEYLLDTEGYNEV